MHTSKPNLHIAVLAAALGYFVDVYDLYLFTVSRSSSLKSLGLDGDALISAGVHLLNWQMSGMLIGGILWGILGDRKGRIKVLFGSIILYSLANIGNGFVHTLPEYAAMRFLAGLGLAGEIGAGITLVSELMPKETRGYATTLVSTVGVFGAAAAGLVSTYFTWRTSYFLGGVMGLGLLIFRIAVHESDIFESVSAKVEVKRGQFFMLFANRERLIRYLSCIVVAVPVWFAAGILITFSPELGKNLNLNAPVSAATASLFWAIGLTVGDLISGMLSQYFNSRRKVMAGFISLAALISVLILNINGAGASTFYGLIAAIGLAMGYWAVFLVNAAEQFGTNLRATVTSTAPNFVRGSTILITTSFAALKPTYGFALSAEIVGGVCFTLAALGLYYLKETFGKDLDFIEE